MDEMSPEEFVRSLLEADPKDLPAIPKVAPMTIKEIVDIPIVRRGMRSSRWRANAGCHGRSV
jgi:hypothetical protein